MSEILTDQRLTTADLVRPTTPPEEPEPAGYESPASMPFDGAVGARNSQPVDGAGPAHNPLFAQDELESLRSNWTKVQSSFVDEPRAAVEQADNLVANVVKRIAEQFASEREQLEKQWDRGDDADTENLRQAIKRYRAFFDRLLAF